MKMIINILTVCVVLSLLEPCFAERPAVEALLRRAASFEQWGQRMYRDGDITASEAAFYQARKLQAEAGELRVAEVDQRAEPAIQRLSLLMEQRLGDLSAAQEAVERRLEALEDQLQKRWNRADQRPPTEIEKVIGDFHELSSRARKVLDHLHGEIKEFQQQLLDHRVKDHADDPREGKPRHFIRGLSDPEDPTIEYEFDEPNRESSARPRRIHLHAALENLNAPPVRQHMRETIQHLHAAGEHELAEQLEHAMHMARERLTDELRGKGRHHPHHGVRPRDDGHARHHDGDDRIERLQDEVTELSARLKRLEQTVKKKKRKSRRDE